MDTTTYTKIALSRSRCFGKEKLSQSLMSLQRPRYLRAFKSLALLSTKIKSGISQYNLKDNDDEDVFFEIFVCVYVGERL